MKQLQYVAAFSLIVTLTGLSPVMAADAGSALGGKTERAESSPPSENRVRMVLTPTQMDKIQGGKLTQYEADQISSAYNAALASGANMMKFHVCYLYGC